jgi:hypothetical protein
MHASNPVGARLLLRQSEQRIGSPRHLATELSWQSAVRETDITEATTYLTGEDLYQIAAINS